MTQKADIIKTRIKELGLTLRKVSVDLHLSYAHLNQVLNGHRNMCKRMECQLTRYLNEIENEAIFYTDMMI